MTIGRGFHKSNDNFDNGGYWETTSSVDFCESNYIISKFVAEPHNAWSSLVLCFFGLIGLIYSNPMKELRVYLMFTIMFIIGIGSCFLHTTLDKLAQSSDELPMLWFNICATYSLIELKTERGSNKYRFASIGGYLFALIQTIIYFGFQDVYIVFLVTYSSLVAVMAVWSYMLIDHKDKLIKRQRSFLWHNSLASYLIIGAIPWIFDMHYCFEMKPYYDSLPFIFKGMTLHVIWHIFAGIGTYYYIVLLVLVRSQTLFGAAATLTFKFGLPVVEHLILKKEVVRGRSRSITTVTNKSKSNRKRSRSKTKTKSS
jgi:dihydroceramidase